MKALPSCPVADVPISRSSTGLTEPPRPAMRIADVMTPDPTTTEVSASIHEAARLMLDHRVGGLPVLHRGLLVGIITHADLVARLVPPGRVQWWRVLIDYERLARDCQRARGTTVGEVMTRPAFFVAPDDAIEAAARLLHDYQVGRLPVLNHGRLVGIVSHSDLLRALIAAPPVSARLEPGAGSGGSAFGIGETRPRTEAILGVRASSRTKCLIRLVAKELGVSNE